MNEPEKFSLQNAEARDTMEALQASSPPDEENNPMRQNSKITALYSRLSNNAMVILQQHKPEDNKSSGLYIFRR